MTSILSDGKMQFRSFVKGRASRTNLDIGYSLRYIREQDARIGKTMIKKGPKPPYQIRLCIKLADWYVYLMYPLSKMRVKS